MYDYSTVHAFKDLPQPVALSVAPNMGQALLAQ
jgi:hypothetical protein